MFTEEQEQDLLANVRSLTDRMTIVDRILRAQKMGENMVLAFRCGHSGLYFRGDYVRNWGRTYGVGLGPEPVSEVLDSDYETAPPDITPQIRRIEQIMHPVGPCFAQVDMDLVDDNLITAEGGWAIPAAEDPLMEERAMIVRARQLENPNGRLRTMQAAWERKGGK